MTCNSATVSFIGLTITNLCNGLYDIILQQCLLSVLLPIYVMDYMICNSATVSVIGLTITNLCNGLYGM